MEGFNLDAYEIAVPRFAVVDEFGGYGLAGADGLAHTAGLDGVRVGTLEELAGLFAHDFFEGVSREAGEAPSANWSEAAQTKRVKRPEAGEALQDGTYEVGEAPSVKWVEAGLTTQDGPLMKALEMLQEQGEEVRRLERQGVALQYELSSYRRALAESAESLAEKDALRKQIESESLRAESLALENAKLREIFEAEKASLTEEVRLSKSRVDWLEKRVPRWVRSLFRAG